MDAVCVLQGARACIIEVDMMFSDLRMLQRLRKWVGQEQLCRRGCICQKTKNTSHLRNLAVCLCDLFQVLMFPHYSFDDKTAFDAQVSKVCF